MWAIRVIKCGVDPDSIWVTGVGNDFAQKLRNKTLRGWRMETDYMRKLMGCVYVVSDYTQKMCEMDVETLANYVISHGRCIS